ASVWMKKDMTAAKHLQMRCRRNPFSGPALVAAHEYLNLSLRAEPERLSASRPCAFRADQFRHGARRRRATAAAHSGHRYHPLPQRGRDRDLRGFDLAWHFLGAAGASPE